MNNVSWSGSELKTKAKEILKKYYWKCVLVGLIALVSDVGCRSEMPSIPNGGSSNSIGNNLSVSRDEYNDHSEFYDSVALEAEEVDINELLKYDDPFSSFNDETNESVSTFMLLLVLLFSLVVIAICACFAIFVTNPLVFGCFKFWLSTTKDDCNLSYIVFGFKNNYMNVVKIMLLINVKIFLWSLLLIIPGIIKSLEYFMVPYILADNPAIPSKEAFALSKKIMDGQKGSLFCLGLSFVGWVLLSIFTFGLLAVFFVTPYACLTMALLSTRLKQGLVQLNNMVNPSVSVVTPRTLP